MPATIQILESVNATWNHVITWFGGLVAICLFIGKVSKDAEEVLDPEKRKSLSEKLCCIKNQNINSWIPDFTLVCDRFFGTKHLSWRCFYRSTVISIITFIILNLLYPTIPFAPSENILTWVFLISFSIINVVIDYISLLETRIILNLSIPTLTKIIVDGILTILLVVIGITIFMVAAIRWMIYMYPDYHSNSPPFPDFFGLPVELFVWLIASPDNLFLIILTTSFTTSIWLWLHGLSIIVIRALNNVQWFMNWLNVKEAPLRAIGITINLIVLTLGILLFPVYLLI